MPTVLDDAEYQSLDAAANEHPLKGGKNEKHRCDSPREHMKADIRYPPEKDSHQQIESCEQREQRNTDEVQRSDHFKEAGLITIEQYAIGNWYAVTSATRIPRFRVGLWWLRGEGIYN